MSALNAFFWRYNRFSLSFARDLGGGEFIELSKTENVFRKDREPSSGGRAVVDEGYEKKQPLQ